ncbi:MAG: SDR family NAD(P)-dependent oxidoreductase [Anaerolineae bacterium]|nr:SDR family NAD(P)-dependent oxidoreductase [Anaerolineae bacterium]
MVAPETTTAPPLIPQIEPEYTLADADTMPRRVPMPALRPSLTQCKPTGVLLNEASRVVVALDEGGVGKALVKKLEKLGVAVLLLDVALAAEAVAAQAQTWLAEGPVQGVYWLPALDVEPDLATMSLADWREANRVRVKNLAVTMRALYDAVCEPGAFLVSATRMGGLHGYGPEPAIAPLGGGVTGFTKAYKRERPSVLVKAVDFEASRKTAAFADLLIAETLADPGCVEVGYWRDGRYTITLMEQPATYDAVAGLQTVPPDVARWGHRPQPDKQVFLVTGAAGGITSAIVADLAAASGGTFYLLDLTPEPDRADPQIALFRADKDALKQQLIEETKVAGEKPTPVMIEKKLAAVERLEAALSAIEAVEKVGGTAVYRSVNLLDHEALTGIVAEIRQQFGRIDVLVHAGGIEISKALNQKDAAQFDLVYDIKADGFYSLLHAAQDLPVAATVVFSSVAGRFGNAGQTDYSAANDLLCKLTSSRQRTRPETKAIAIDWTAWGGIGMATRGSIPKIMEYAGIEMLPPAAGIPTVRRELLVGGGEVLVGGKLGLLVDEWDESGGILTRRRGGAEEFLLVGGLAAAKVYGGWEVETVLDPKEQPFLYDHAMEGTPLLPGVMGTEAFAELAQTIAPDYHVTAVFNEQFHAPFKFYRMEPQTLYLRGTAVPDGDDLLVYAALHSRRELKGGLQEKLHFTATVCMSRKPAEVASVDFTPPATLDIGKEAIYDIYFHGPAYQVLEAVQVEGSRAIGLLAENLPPNMNPADALELLAPRLIELCFQTAGVWQIRQRQTMALPLAIGAVSVYRQEREVVDGRRLYAIVEAVNGGEEFNAQVVDTEGAVYLTLTGYKTVSLPGQVTL